MEKEIISPEVVRVRCPQCLKLYKVPTHSIQTKKPKFQCNQCQEYFSLSFPECLGLEEVIGFAASWEMSAEEFENFESEESTQIAPTEPAPVEELKPRNATSSQKVQVDEHKIPCIKCGALNMDAAKECSKCGVIFEKFREQVDDPLLMKAPQKLREFWFMLKQHYEDEDLHEEFLRQCRKAGQLEFASSRYRKVLDVQPNEEIAKKFKNKIIALTNIAMDPVELKTEKKKFRVPFVSLAMLLSAVVLFMGYFLPEYRNLMGIGAAFLFITTAIRLIFK